MILGVTYMDVTKTENNIKTRQLLTERFTGTWAISYRLNKNVLILTARCVPLLGALDPRSEYSPTWSIHPIHF
jgi:outer membrane receptor for ferrienterochelin and colicins